MLSDALYFAKANRFFNAFAKIGKIHEANVEEKKHLTEVLEKLSF